MSLEDARKFRQVLRDNPALGQEFGERLKSGGVDVGAFAREHGYELEISQEDAQNCWEELQAGGELSDLELELVSAGYQRCQDARIEK